MSYPVDDWFNDSVYVSKAGREPHKEDRPDLQGGGVVLSYKIHGCDSMVPGER